MLRGDFCRRLPRRLAADAARFEDANVKFGMATATLPP
jgi:hypothetical protein